LPEPPADDSLIGLLTCASSQKPLVIILDQFEEFFTRLDAQQRAAFIDELCLVLSRRDLPVKWLLAFRSESLARLNEFRPAIPDIFKAEFYLTPLRASAAVEAISRPAALANLGVEPELQKAIISDLGQQGWISPPQLQIICYEVYQTTLSRQDNTLRFEYYKERGGAREILSSYLEQALRRLPPRAKQVLIALVSGDGTPAVLSVEAVARAARLTLDESASLLDQLEDEWLVKTILREGQPHYELAHAYLAAGLAVDPEVLQRKAMEELLHRNILDWERYRILLSPEELQAVQNWAEKIDFSLDSQKLLLRSAIQRNYQLPYWLKKVNPEIIAPILKEFLRGSDTVKPQPEIALSALSSISQREAYKDDLCSLLEEISLAFDPRKQAALYLAQMDPSVALRLLRNCQDQLKA